LHFQQKGSIVLLMLLQLPAGISDDTVFSGLVDLRQDGAEPAGVGGVSEGGVDDEGVRPVVTRVVNNRFRAQTGLKFTKSFESVGRKRSRFPS
jgi:hypothetical protein